MYYFSTIALKIFLKRVEINHECGKKIFWRLQNLKIKKLTPQQSIIVLQTLDHWKFKTISEDDNIPQASIKYLI